MSHVTVYCQGDDEFLPVYQTEHSAGADLKACLSEPVKLSPGERALISAGFRMALPPGWEAQVRPRSGLALKRGVTVLNAPGTVDADYRGTVGVILINHGAETYTIQPGDRIAQMVVQPVKHAAFRGTDNLPETERGDGGFGSTGR